MTLKRMNGLQKSLGKSTKSLKIKPPSVFMPSTFHAKKDTERTYLTYLKTLALQKNWAIFGSIYG